MMRGRITRLGADETGGVLVEATVMLVILFVFVLGSVDFLMAMYQWNAATKAVQQGARIAAVSSPVSSDLAALTGLGGGVNPGEPMPYFSRVCASGSCSGGLSVPAHSIRLYMGAATSRLRKRNIDLYRRHV